MKFHDVDTCICGGHRCPLGVVRTGDLIVWACIGWQFWQCVDIWHPLHCTLVHAVIAMPPNNQ
eukprot:12172570-Prorocentrum_lima.AAC.1